MQQRRIGASRNGRIFTSIPVEVRVHGRKVEGTVRNANEGGMFVETRSIPMQGEAVSLRFLQRSISNVEVKGLVWWTTEDEPGHHKGPGFGIRLLDESDDYRSFLESLSSTTFP